MAESHCPTAQINSSRRRSHIWGNHCRSPTPLIKQAVEWTSNSCADRAELEYQLTMNQRIVSRLRPNLDCFLSSIKFTLTVFAILLTIYLAKGVNRAKVTCVNKTDYIENYRGKLLFLEKSSDYRRIQNCWQPP